MWKDHRHWVDNNKINTGTRYWGDVAHYNNTCIQDVGLNGTTIGYDTGLGIGTAAPDSSPTGQEFYGLSWSYPSDAGLFIIKWGSTGTAKLYDTDEIYIKKDDGTQEWTAPWNEVTERYEFTDVDLEIELNADYDDGGIAELCFGMYLLPNKFISYSFTELMRGA